MKEDPVVENMMNRKESVLIVEGTLNKSGRYEIRINMTNNLFKRYPRVLHYMIRENNGSSFAINLFVVATKQKWSLLVPFSAVISLYCKISVVLLLFDRILLNCFVYGAWLLAMRIRALLVLGFSAAVTSSSRTILL
jgi:hypothetical protein